MGWRSKSSPSKPSVAILGTRGSKTQNYGPSQVSTSERLAGQRWDLITVTYNSAVALKESWVGVNLPPDVNWIVVDNNSDDDSVDVAKSLGATVIRLPKNVGFGAACNIGFSAGQSPFVCFVNPDVTVRPETLPQLEKVLDTYPKSLVSPQLLNTDGSLQPNGRGTPYLVHKVMHRIAPDKLDGSYRIFAQPGEVIEAAWLTGAVLAGLRPRFEKLGPFDESFFVYQEDSDLGLRNNKDGGTNMVIGDVNWVHHWSRETKGFNLKAWRLELASSRTFYRRYPDLVFIPRVKHYAISTTCPDDKSSADSETEIAYGKTVTFILRSDYRTKGGGDTIQAMKYADELKKLGWRCNVHSAFDYADIPNGSVVHIMNVDRPFDFLNVFSQLDSTRVVVSPIHHELKAVSDFRRVMADSAPFGWLIENLPESLIQYISFIKRLYGSRKTDGLRWVMRNWALATFRVPRVWRSVGKALNESAAVTLLAKGEGDSLKSDTGWDGHNLRLIPNGQPDVDFAQFAKPWNERNTSIVCVGRIEPGKRQLELLVEAEQLRVGITFAGAMSDTFPDYGNTFSELIKESPHSQWLGELPHNDILELMGDSKVLLNGSALEVQSLVDIEASFAGCRVVATDRGYSKEWLGDSISVVNTLAPATLVERANAEAQRTTGPQMPDYPQTWNTAALQLDEIYRAIIEQANN